METLAANAPLLAAAAQAFAITLASCKGYVAQNAFQVVENAAQVKGIPEIAGSLIQEGIVAAFKSC